MKGKGATLSRLVSPKALVVLLAVASIGTTALVGITVLVRHKFASNRGGAIAQPNPQPNPPILLTLPSFSLTDHHGNGYGSQQLQGKVWIANFIFTRCAGPCPMMTSRMAQLQNQLSSQTERERIRLVSFSVDPDHDTTTVLQEYAGMARADEQMWHFLTGLRSQIWQLIIDGFCLPVGEAALTSPMPIVHSQKFVLVDGSGRVRGFYDGLTEAGRIELIDDVNLVLSEPDKATASFNPVHSKER